MAETRWRKLFLRFDGCDYVAQCARNVVSILRPEAGVVAKSQELKKYLANVTRRVETYAIVIGDKPVNPGETQLIEKWLEGKNVGHIQLTLSSKAAHGDKESVLNSTPQPRCGCTNSTCACLHSKLYPVHEHVQVLYQAALRHEKPVLTGGSLANSVSSLRVAPLADNIIQREVSAGRCCHQ